jgi:hypothetical protein
LAATMQQRTRRRRSSLLQGSVGDSLFNGSGGRSNPPLIPILTAARMTPLTMATKYLITLSRGIKAAAATAALAIGFAGVPQAAPRRKFEHIGVVATVGAFASIAVVAFILAMQYPVGRFNPILIPGVRIDSQPLNGHRTVAAGSAKTVPDHSGGTSTPTAENAIQPAPLVEALPTAPAEQVIAPAKDAVPPREAMFADFAKTASARTETTPLPAHKPSVYFPPPSYHRPWRQKNRHWDRAAPQSEAVRLMRDDLDQRGVRR